MNIENIKTVLAFVIGIGERVDKVTAEDSAGGKKITGGEWLGSAVLLTGVPGLLKSIPEFLPEFKDLDSEEKAELKDFVNTEFDIANDKLESVIEKAVGIAIELSNIAQLFSKD